MPIEKATTERFIKEDIGYEIISRDVIQGIKNPTALAIYTYLITLPANWVPRRQHLLDHFNGLGRDRYDSAMRELREASLIWTAITRNELGQIIDRVMIVETTPKSKGHLKSENLHAGNPALRETRPLKDTDTIKDTDINKYKAPKPSQFIPPTLQEVKDYVIEKGYKFDAQRFIDYYEADNWYDNKGNKVKNWKRRAVTWGSNNHNVNQESAKGSYL
tara:strand:- start:2134 stop:2787 length:654 start_codon:yes stop_codon:yes gene_type:complete